MDFTGLILTNDFSKLSVLKIKDFRKLLVNKKKLLTILVYHPIIHYQLLLLEEGDTETFFLHTLLMIMRNHMAISTSA